MPLAIVLADIKLFIRENPSEVVTILLRQDYSSVNADWWGIRKLQSTKVSKVENLEVIIPEIRKIMGNEAIHTGSLN